MIPYPAVRRKAGGARDFLLGFLDPGGQSSRVFFLGFVIVGRSFLLIGIEKGQSISRLSLGGKFLLSYSVKTSSTEMGFASYSISKAPPIVSKASNFDKSFSAFNDTTT